MGLTCWLTAVTLTIWGTWLSSRLLQRRPKDNPDPRPGPRSLEPISILKPLKGLEENIEKNLESFFDLDYPAYELIFCVANEADPAVPVLRKFIAVHPGRPGHYGCQSTRLMIGEGQVGPNPKVNNLIHAYREATHNWILISDSNVRVNRTYLRSVVAPFAEDVGIVTAVVAGCEPEASGGWLEAVFLNTFYARWMIVSKQIGIPVVVGKSMLFRRSDANRFGGLSVLGRYLAEDYMAGQAMKLIGRKVEIMSVAVRQPLGHYAFKSFWSRHIRWGRIRKSQAPQAFLAEPVLSFWLSGLIGALSVKALFDFSFFATLALHTAIWLAADLTMISLVAPETLRRGPLRAALAWMARETLHLPLWLHIATGSTVNWRGRKLVLARGGILKT